MTTVANIFTHQGLGDQFECLGLIRNLRKSYLKVNIVCKHRYLKDVTFLYRDDPAINVHVMPPECNNNYKKEKEFYNKIRQENKGHHFYVGHHNYFPHQQEFNDIGMAAAQAFYHIANLPYESKFKDFYFQRDKKQEDRVYKKLNPFDEKYVFVHDDKNRGFNIDIFTEHKVIENDMAENMCHMIKVLENAEEIHCMSSSLFCLIDCIGASKLIKSKINDVPKFLHWNVRRVWLGKNDRNYLGSDNWTILK